MPTPSDDAIMRTPSIEASSSRTSFASCPPEEDREYHAPREERVDVETVTAGEDAHMTTQEPTPEPEAQAGAAVNASPIASNTPEKAEHVEDVAVVAEDLHSSAGSPDAPSESETRLSQSMSKTEISSTSLPQYLTFPRDVDRVRSFGAAVSLVHHADLELANIIHHILFPETG